MKIKVRRWGCDPDNITYWYWVDTISTDGNIAAVCISERGRICVFSRSEIVVVDDDYIPCKRRV